MPAKTLQTPELGSAVAVNTVVTLAIPVDLTNAEFDAVVVQIGELIRQAFRRLFDLHRKLLIRPFRVEVVFIPE